MKIFAIVPVKSLDRSKSRLSRMLTAGERVELSALMLKQTLGVLTNAAEIGRTVVVSSDRRAGDLANLFARTEFIHQSREDGVNSAVELANNFCMQNGAEATLVVPQDLPLLSHAEISEIISRAQASAEKMENPSSVVICPSQRLDGTNVLLRSPPDLIATTYDDNSFQNHVASARKKGLTPEILSFPATALDIDTPEDVADALSQNGCQNPVLDFLGARLRREKNSEASPALGER